MKKSVTITLVLVFCTSMIASGAFGISDCASMCSREMMKAQHLQHGEKGSAHVTAMNCCSGGVPDACDFSGHSVVKLPECSMTVHSVHAPNLTGIGFSTVDPEADTTRSIQSGLFVYAGVRYTNLPLYLQNLSILC